jgi:hypothetical protein
MTINRQLQMKRFNASLAMRDLEKKFSVVQQDIQTPCPHRD